MKIIGITGPAGAGKNTLGDIFEEHLHMQDKTCIQLSLAAPLKRAGTSMFGWIDLDRDQKEAEHKDYGFSPRSYWQDLGKWMRDTYGADIFVRILRDTVAMFDDSDFVIVTDVRYDNEADWIKKQGGCVIKIDRDVEKVRDHESENGVSMSFIDGGLSNNSTIEALEVEGIQLLKTFID